MTTYVAHRRRRRRSRARRLAPVVGDLRSVVGMFRPVQHTTQAPPPSLPWTESVVVDRGARGQLLVRHTPGIDTDDRIPVVLLHGITLTADVNFFALADLVEKKYPAIVFDAPNHGTGLSVDTFTFTDVADDIVAILDQLGVQKAIVCGYSLGGITAMVFGDRHPTRTAGVVVQAAAMRYGVAARERVFLASVAAVHRLGLDTATKSLPLRYWRVSAHRSAAARSQWTWLEEQLSVLSAQPLAPVFDAVARFDHRALQRTAPTVVLVHRRDRVCPPRLQREAAAKLQAHVIVVDADHDLPVADPETFARVTDHALRWVLSRG